MKKLIALILALTLVMSFAACAAKKEPAVEQEPEVEENVVIDTPVVEDESLNQPAEMPEEGENQPAEMPEVAPEEEMPEIEFMPEEKLNEMLGLLDQLVGGINDELTVMNTEVTSDMFEYLVGAAYVDGAYAVASAPMIGSIPMRWFWSSCPRAPMWLRSLLRWKAIWIPESGSAWKLNPAGSRPAATMW